MPAVTITQAPLTIEELLEVAHGALVELGPDARTLIGASRAVVDAALASGRPVYGLNTGVGHMKDVRLPEGEVRRLQQVLVITHAGVHPVVPAISSVAAGDLGQMACVAVVATGMGWAEHQGELLPGAQALARAGIQPLAPCCRPR